MTKEFRTSGQFPFGVKLNQNSDKTHLAALREDSLLNFREVNRMLGSRCKSGHFALRLAKKGQIRGVFLNARIVRYSENSVRDLIAGKVGAA